jgi:hypothetical protein
MRATNEHARALFGQVTFDAVGELISKNYSLFGFRVRQDDMRIHDFLVDLG